MNGVSELGSLNGTTSCQSRLKIMNQLGSKSKESLVFSCINRKRKDFFKLRCGY